MTFAAGDNTATVIVNPALDKVAESNETIALTVSAGSGYALGVPFTAIGMITDDDAPTVTLTRTGSPMAEATGMATVTAMLSAKSDLPVTVNLAFSGTATLTSDYTATPTSITIPAGSTSGSITLTAVPDTLDESDETIVVDVDSVSNGTEDGTQQVTATISDDDLPPCVTLGLTGSPMAEAGGVATVSALLSAVSGLPVTVNLVFSGTATLTADYSRSGTSIVIPPGSTSGSITLTAVQDTVDKADETIVVDIDTVINGTECETQSKTAKITNDDLVRFFVVDNMVDDMFGYATGGENLKRSDLVSGATDARGITTTVDASKFWILNGNKVVYVVDAAGKSLGSWSAAQLRQPTGIATDGTDIWIVDKGTDTVYRFNNAAAVTTGSLQASSSFKLARTNAVPEGLATDGTKIWVVNSGSPDRVFVYNMSGTSLGNWSIDSTNVSPTGITIDPTGASQSIWIVDISKDRVFEYADARSWMSGRRKASSSFALAPGNTSPQDIVDPDVSLRSLTAENSAGGDREPAIRSDAEASSSAAAFWDPYALASPTPAGTRPADSRQSNLGGTVSQPRSAMVQWHASTRVRAAFDQADAGPGLAIDRSGRTADEAWDELLAVLAGRSRSDWLVAADGLFSELIAERTIFPAAAGFLPAKWWLGG